MNTHDEYIATIHDRIVSAEQEISLCEHKLQQSSPLDKEQCFERAELRLKIVELTTELKAHIKEWEQEQAHYNS